VNTAKRTWLGCADLLKPIRAPHPKSKAGNRWCLTKWGDVDLAQGLIWQAQLKFKDWWSKKENRHGQRRRHY
jgi:hypothetical protein